MDNQPVLVLGKNQPHPSINFWLDSYPDGTVVLKARHSKDVDEQTIAELKFDISGRLQLVTRDIYATNLCAAMVVARGEGIKTSFRRGG